MFTKEREELYAKRIHDRYMLDHMIKELESQLDDLDDKIIQMMKEDDAKKYITSDHIVTLVEKHYHIFNHGTFKKDHSDLYEAYKTFPVDQEYVIIK